MYLAFDISKILYFSVYRRIKTRNSSTIGTSASVRLDYDSYIWFFGFSDIRSTHCTLRASRAGSLNLISRYINENIYEILDQARFKGYCCKSDMPFYKWKVTWNYAYSPYKGGDLLKWERSRVHHVVGLDIAETSIEQCKDRYDKMKVSDFIIDW